MKIVYSIWAAPETITPAAVGAIAAAAAEAKFAEIEIAFDGEAIALIGLTDEAPRVTAYTVYCWASKQWRAAGMKPLDFLWAAEGGQAGHEIF